MTGVEDVKPGSLKAWMAFTRPKTWGVAVAPVIAALSLALFETGRFDALTAFFTMTIALLMQIISNMKNDLGYTEKKAETGNRRGLPRATTQGWISISAARRAILTLIVLALLNTAVLIWLGGWVFALIGISSVIAAYSYMGGPKPIAYTPFGEATVLVFFGLTAVCSSYYLQTFTSSSASRSARSRPPCSPSTTGGTECTTRASAAKRLRSCSATRPSRQSSES